MTYPVEVVTASTPIVGDQTVTIPEAFRVPGSWIAMTDADKDALYDGTAVFGSGFAIPIAWGGVFQYVEGINTLTLPGSALRGAEQVVMLLLGAGYADPFENIAQRKNSNYSVSTGGQGQAQADPPAGSYLVAGNTIVWGGFYRGSTGISTASADYVFGDSQAQLGANFPSGTGPEAWRYFLGSWTAPADWTAGDEPDIHAVMPTLPSDWRGDRFIWAPGLIPTPEPTGRIAPLRYRQRNDGVRQGQSSSSKQASTRQGWPSTYL